MPPLHVIHHAVNRPMNRIFDVGDDWK